MTEPTLLSVLQERDKLKEELSATIVERDGLREALSGAHKILEGVPHYEAGGFLPVDEAFEIIDKALSSQEVK